MEVVLCGGQHEAERGGAERAHRVDGAARHQQQPLEAAVTWNEEKHCKLTSINNFEDPLYFVRFPKNISQRTSVFLGIQYF